jgi:TolB-like protein/Tfp pilus assembly protein PilF
MPGQPPLDKQAAAETVGEIPRDAVLAALDKVIASEAFGKAERPARFLRHLVETALRGENSFLKESVLGTDVFERPASWDPRLDPVVRQEAARLRKRLANYYENGGSGTEVRIELPVGSYVPVFRCKPAEIEAPAVEPVPPRRSQVWFYAAVAGILCVAGAIIAWRAFLPRESAISIAVLPFTNLPADPANEYFSDGLTDEITDSLARVKALRVVARSSAFQFKGKTVDIREVGRLLNVTDVLEGSVARSGDRIKIIAHLERVSDRTLVWSNTYERKASDSYIVQSELAADVAAGLKVAAALPPPAHVPNVEAYDLVLKGLYEMQQFTSESMTRAESDFQQAIDKDPKYAAAYARLAAAKFDQFVARGSTYQTEAERKSVEQLAGKALELEPDLPTAHSLLGLLAMQYEWDWGRAAREFQLGIAGDRTPDAESNYAFLLIFHGRFAEADQHLRRYQGLEPFATVTMYNVAFARYLEGRFSETREISRRAAEEHPKILWTQQLIGMSYVTEGHPELALPIFQQLKQRSPTAQIFEAMAQAKAGQREEALRLIRHYEQKYPKTGVPMQWLALVYAYMGDESSTVRWLQRSADLHEFQVLNLAINPAYPRMRNSPGFRALEKRIGLIQ